MKIEKQLKLRKSTEELWVVFQHVWADLRSSFKNLVQVNLEELMQFEGKRVAKGKTVNAPPQTLTSLLV